MAASEIGGKGKPCVFGLLPNKKKETYDIFFNKIKKHVGEQNCPKTVISDFEQAVFSKCASVSNREPQRLQISSQRCSLEEPGRSSSSGTV